jgi:hypothetical protein
MPSTDINGEPIVVLTLEEAKYVLTLIEFASLRSLEDLTLEKAIERKINEATNNQN